MPKEMRRASLFVVAKPNLASLPRYEAYTQSLIALLSSRTRLRGTRAQSRSDWLCAERAPLNDEERV